jgi:hypothetical protein
MKKKGKKKTLVNCWLSFLLACHKLQRKNHIRYLEQIPIPKASRVSTPQIDQLKNQTMVYVP